ncbi:MAG: NDP-sugar synthase [Oligoflexia bacterium]
MAAGVGTRLRPFSERLAKPLVPVLGVPCAQFAIDLLLEAGVQTIVANVHHLPDSTRQGLESLDLGGARLVVSDESSELLGSAGGIRKALAHLEGGPFFIANADVLCSLDWAALGRRHQLLKKKWGVGLTLALMPISKDAKEDYREIRLDEQSERIVGLGTRSRSGLMYVGCAVVEPELFRNLSPEKNLEFVPEILEPAIRSGVAGAYVMPPQDSWLWLDVGSPHLWWRAHMELMERLETAGVPRVWRHRIERVAVRRGPMIWTGRELARRLDLSDSEGPLYWGASGIGKLNPKGPIRLDSGSVIYGEPCPQARGAGISAMGFWAQVP